MRVSFLHPTWIVKVDCEKLSLYILISCETPSLQIQKHIVKNEWVSKNRLLKIHRFQKKERKEKQTNNIDIEFPLKN